MTPFAPDAEREQSLRELRALQRVADEVSRSLDLDVVLGGCLDIAMEIADASAGSIFLRDEHRPVYRRAYIHNAMLPAFEPTPELVSGLLGNQGSCIIEANTAPDSEASARARELGFRYAVLLALRIGPEPLGVVALAFKTPVLVSCSMRRTLEAIAAHEAVAIENARVHQAAAERAQLASVLREFGARALGVAEESAARDLILETVCRITASDRALLARLGEGRLQVIAAAGKDKPFIGHQEPATDAVFARVLHQTEPWVVEEVRELEGESFMARVARAQQTRSFVLLPLRHRSRPIGLLFAGSGEPRRYTSAALEALQILGSMAAEVLERERLEAEAQAQLRRLEASIEHLPVHIAVLSPRGVTLHANETARRFGRRMGWPAGSDWRQTLGQLRYLDGNGRELTPAELPLQRAFAGERVGPLEVLMTAPDGSFRFHVLAVAAPIFDADQRVQSLVTAFHDISPLREVTQSKDRFISIASHELRSPITSLRASAALLQMDPTAQTSEERRRTLLGRMQRQVDRLERLVEQLLESARLGTASVELDWTECDLATICREAIELCAPGESARVLLEAEQPVVGRWDPGRLEQVVVNLLSNALRYGAAGAQVILRVREEGARAFVEVIDRGIGIPPDQIDHLFEPFYRGSNAIGVHRAGLGLGLHISSEIVRRHHGTVRVESQLGEGSTFTVELPKDPQMVT